MGKDSSVVSRTVTLHLREILTGECMGAVRYAKLTGHRSLGIPPTKMEQHFPD